MLRIAIASLMCLTLVSACPAAWSAPNKTAEVTARGPRKQITTIVFAGIAGAILGLSTLSFYGRPQDRLNNIAVGAAVGIISGTIYTTFKAATEPREFYNLREFAGDELLLSRHSAAAEPVPRLLWSLEF